MERERGRDGERKREKERERQKEKEEKRRRAERGEKKNGKMEISSDERLRILQCRE